VRVVPDGYGGAIVVWVDDRTGIQDIYAQRIDQAGRGLWAAGGIPVCTALGSQREIEIAPDGYGGVLVVWKDYRTLFQSKVYAQRLNSSGSALWTPDGVSVCGGSGNQTDACVTTDGSGGAIVAWSDFRGANLDIYANHINSGGTVLWGADGAPVCVAGGTQNKTEICSDGEGGAIFAWIDARFGGHFNIYAQRFDRDGYLGWPTVDGIAVRKTTSTEQDSPQVVSDGEEGAIIVFRQLQIDNNEWHIKAQRIDDAGTFLWGDLNVCWLNGSNRYYPRAISDGFGGVIVAWSDDRPSAINMDIFVQRLDADGNEAWTFSGNRVCYENSNQVFSALVTDGAGGAIIAWSDARYGLGNDIYAQYVDGSGDFIWQDGGVVLCDAAEAQWSPQIVPNGIGGAIVAWEDERNGSDSDVYAQRINSAGETNLAPIISFVRDVPHDQGGSVAVAWNRSGLDEAGAELITVYSIWRALPQEVAMSMRDKVPELNSVEMTERFSGPAIRVTAEGAAQQYWEWVANIPAHWLSGYSYCASTLFDSTGSTDAYHSFFVSAHTADPYVFWDSEPDSGYSVDNLAPCVPLGLAGEQSYSPGGLELSWSPNLEEDLGGYNIYRGTGSEFVPEEGSLLFSTCDTVYFDGGWPGSGDDCYKVSALDVHGNESGHALLCAGQVTGVEPAELPDAIFLAQNYPNPFNPATTISYRIQKTGPVSLRIYSTCGRAVVTLVDGVQSAGRQEIIWNGNDGAGNAVASGVYYYKLVAGEFSHTRKMLLLK